MANNYFKSRDIKVFPASYRGMNSDIALDPESRMITESNYCHILGLAGNRRSYIVEHSKTRLCCIIAGYYFEIAGDAFEIIARAANCLLKINLVEHTLSEDSIIDSKRSTYILAPFDSTDVGPLDTSDGHFKGLAYDTDTINPDIAETQLCVRIAGVWNQEVDISLDALWRRGNNLKSFEAGEGLYTAAENKNSITVGSYNEKIEEDTSKFTVGVGTSDTSRKTLLRAVPATETTTAYLEVKGNINLVGEDLKLNGTAAQAETIKVGSAFKELKAALLDLVYPVGSIYLTVEKTSPATLFGGTWELLDAGKFLRSGDIGKDLTVGGVDSITLGEENLPKHLHAAGDLNVEISTEHSHSISELVVAEHKHSLGNITVEESSCEHEHTINFETNQDEGIHSHRVEGAKLTLAEAGSHTHYFSGAARAQSSSALTSELILTTSENEYTHTHAAHYGTNGTAITSSAGSHNHQIYGNYSTAPAAMTRPQYIELVDSGRHFWTIGTMPFDFDGKQITGLEPHKILLASAIDYASKVISGAKLATSSFQDWNYSLGTTDTTPYHNHSLPSLNIVGSTCSHSHEIILSSGLDNFIHDHTVSLPTPGFSGTHTHTATLEGDLLATSNNHSHIISGVTGYAAANHSHKLKGTTGATSEEITITIGNGGQHTHKLSGETGTAGSETPTAINIIPSFLDCYMWKRLI